MQQNASFFYGPYMYNYSQIGFAIHQHLEMQEENNSLNPSLEKKVLRLNFAD
jgi:hypothetical protein